jgi:hypothetical protein
MHDSNHVYKLQLRFPASEVMVVASEDEDERRRREERAFVFVRGPGQSVWRHR